MSHLDIPSTGGHYPTVSTRTEAGRERVSANTLFQSAIFPCNALSHSDMLISEITSSDECKKGGRG